MDSSSSLPPASLTGGEDLALSRSAYSFECCVCLDLLYKPIVLACGHVSCFWCTNKAMDGLRPSRCAICRQQYNHFPRICRLLHLLLLKMEPVSYKLREKEILEEENIRGCFSPQFIDHPVSMKADADKHNSDTIEDKTFFSQNGTRIEFSDRISVADVLCSGCKELLFRPSVLNCGHVYCESCVSGQPNGCLKCQVCETSHPGEFPNVCWELDDFLQEQFPEEYTSRREKVQLMKLRCQHGEPSHNDAMVRGIVQTCDVMVRSCLDQLHQKRSEAPNQPADPDPDSSNLGWF